MGGWVANFPVALTTTRRRARTRTPTTSHHITTDLQHARGPGCTSGSLAGLMTARRREWSARSSEMRHPKMMRHAVAVASEPRCIHHHDIARSCMSHASRLQRDLREDCPSCNRCAGEMVEARRGEHAIVMPKFRHIHAHLSLRTTTALSQRRTCLHCDESRCYCMLFARRDVMLPAAVAKQPGYNILRRDLPPLRVPRTLSHLAHPWPNRWFLAFPESYSSTWTA